MQDSALKIVEDYKAGRITREQRDKLVASLHADRQFAGVPRKVPPPPTVPVVVLKTHAVLATERTHGQRGAANATHVSPAEQERREAARLQREKEARKAARVARETAAGKAPKPPRDRTLRYQFCLAGSMQPREAEDRDEACAHIVKTLLGDDAYSYAKVETGAFLIVWFDVQPIKASDTPQAYAGTTGRGKAYWYATHEGARKAGIEAIAQGASDTSVTDRLYRSEVVQFGAMPARDQVIPSRKRGPVTTRPNYDNYRGGVWMRCKNSRASFSGG